MLIIDMNSLYVNLEM